LGIAWLVAGKLSGVDLGWRSAPIQTGLYNKTSPFRVCAAGALGLQKTALLVVALGRGRLAPGLPKKAEVGLFEVLFPLFRGEMDWFVRKRYLARYNRDIVVVVTSFQADFATIRA